MLVTKIEELSKSRSKVYVDQEFAFVLYKGELRKYHIREGEELAEEDYEAIQSTVLPNRAKMRAMNLLLHREYTTAQLREKLRQGLYSEDAVESALEYVASFHYTDDLRYAVDYIRCHEDSRSRRRIGQDLTGKGISKETQNAAWRQWEEQGGVQDEEQMIRQLLRKRNFDSRTADYREMSKQAAFLCRKGFESEKIWKVLSDFYLT